MKAAKMQERTDVDDWTLERIPVEISATELNGALCALGHASNRHGPRKGADQPPVTDCRGGAIMLQA
jgi:hypothetical protein